MIEPFIHVQQTSLLLDVQTCTAQSLKEVPCDVGRQVEKPGCAGHLPDGLSGGVTTGSCFFIFLCLLSPRKVKLTGTW